MDGWVEERDEGMDGQKKTKEVEMEQTDGEKMREGEEGSRKGTKNRQNRRK